MKYSILPLISKGTTASALCILLASSGVLFTGCANISKESQRSMSPAWPMTPEASETYYYLKLNDAVRHKNKAMADDAIRNLLMMSPPLRVYLDIATYYSRQKDPVVARSIIKDGISRFPDNLQLTLLLAQTYLAEKRSKDAQQVLMDYMEQYPDSVEARQELGMLLYRAKKYPEAADILGAKGPGRKLPLSRYYFARALSKLQRYKEAETELKLAVKTSPDFIEAWAELAFVYELQKDFLAAESTYEHLISIGHAGQEVWLRLISINLKLNRPDEALELARRGPVSNRFVMQAATLFMEESFFDQANALLKPYADKTNVPEEIRFHLALLAYQKNKDYQTAIDYLLGIPPHSRLWDRATIFRSQLLFEMGNIDKAVQVMDNARQSDMGNREFWEIQADLLASSKRYDEALALVSDALARWKDDAELLFTKATVLDKMGRKEAAVSAMEKVIEVDPQHPNALNYVGYSLAVEGKNLERALVLIKTALQLEPNKHFILDSLAWVQFKLGKIDSAWETINRVVKLGLNDPEVWEHYGDIAHAKGLLKEARKGYKRALATHPANAAEIKRKLKEL